MLYQVLLCNYYFCPDEFGIYSQLINHPDQLIAHVKALLSLFLITVISLIAFHGWGVLMRSISGFKRPERIMAIDILLGIVLATCLTSFFHLFVRIDWVLSTLFIITGLFASIRSTVLWKNCFRSLYYFLNQYRALTFFALILLFLIASKVLSLPIHGDSFLYHLNSIKWINEYAIIPGLGNLHGRLAFNQIYFDYLALLNFYPFWGNAPGAGNFLFFILTIWGIAEIYLAKLAAWPWLLICLLMATLKNVDLIASTNTDFIINLTEIFIFTQIILGLAKHKSLQKFEDYVIPIYLCVFLVMIKLSSVIFAMGCIVIICYYAKISGSKFTWNFRKYFNICGICSFFIITHLLRGYLLSGAPLYPSTLGYISSLPWSVPLSAIQSEANWVYSWAKAPGINSGDVLGNWSWLLPWMDQLPLTFEVILLSATVLILLNALLKSSSKVIASLNQNLSLLYIPLLGSLLFWFLSAPAIRFVGAIPELLLTLASYQTVIKYWSRPLLIGSLKIQRYLYTILVISIFLYGVKNIGVKKISLSGWVTPPPVNLMINITYSGLNIYSPIDSDLCGDSKLPCTPYFNKAIRTLGKDINSGFGLDYRSKDIHIEK